MSNEPFLLAVDFCLSNITTNPLCKTHEDSALQRISQLQKSANCLSSCISAITSLKEFLSYKNENVKNAAAQAIISLLEKALVLLLKIRDPEEMLEYALILYKLIVQIQNSIDKSSSACSKLHEISEQILKIIESLLLKNKLSLGRQNHDHFTSSNQNKSGNLIRNEDIDSFVSKNLKDTIDRFLVGNVGLDKFQSYSE